MKIYLFLFLLVQIFIVPCWAQGDEKQKIYVRGDHNFAPFEYLDENNNPAGFDIDILNAVAKAMNLEIEINLGPWDEVRNELERGEIDALAGMRYSEERDFVLDFSVPYLINTSAIFIRRSSDIRSPDDLQGKQIIVQSGDIMDDYLQDINLDANIVFVKNQIEALKLLASGKYDAALCSRLRGLYLAHKLKLDNITTAGPELAGGGYGFAVVEGNNDLLALLNEGLRIIKATGRYDEIYQQWFGLYEKKSFYQDLWSYAAWILMPSLLFLAAVLVWSWTLKRQVKSKSQELAKQFKKRQRAEARFESERRFRYLIEASPVPMATIDSDQRILYVNQTFTELFGYTLEDLSDYKTWWRLVCGNSEDIQMLVATWENRTRSTASPSPKNGPFDVKVTCLDGSERYATCSHAAIDDRHILVFNDISERVKAERNLAYRSKIEAMVSSISTRFVNLVSNEVDEEINRALGQIGEEIGVDRCYVFKFKTDNQIMSNTHEWCAPGVESHKERLQALSAKKFPWFLKKLVADGIFHCESIESLGPEARLEKQEWLQEGIKSLITVPMLLKGKMVGFIGFDVVRQEKTWPKEVPFLLRIVGESFANALERRRIEANLRSAHQRLQDIIDFLPDATFVINHQGRVIAWNRAIEEMTGVAEDEVLGRGDYTYAIPFYGERRPTLADMIQSPDVHSEADKSFLQSNKTSLVAEQYLPNLYKGKGAYVWAKASALYDRHGELYGAIESIRDITDRKEEQEKLKASNRELEAFVYTVSHDLRSPLTPIIGYAQYLKEHYRDHLDEQAIGCLSDIHESGNKMLTLLEDLLDLAKVGRLEVPNEPVDSNMLIDEIMEELSPMARKTGVQVINEGLPPLRLPRTLLYQMFSNLLSNAIRYAGKEGGSIEVGGQSEEGHTRLYVRDHGPGIPAPERERIFEVFYRSAKAKKSPGTGVGLATVQKIARLYDGRVKVEETPGGGATFWVEIISVD